MTAQELAKLRAVAADIARNTSVGCWCDEPPPGESGIIECTACAMRRWMAAIREVTERKARPRDTPVDGRKATGVDLPALPYIPPGEE